MFSLLVYEVGGLVVLWRTPDNPPFCLHGGSFHLQVMTSSALDVGVVVVVGCLSIGVSSDLTFPRSRSFRNWGGPHRAVSRSALGTFG